MAEAKRLQAMQDMQFKVEAAWKQDPPMLDSANGFISFKQLAFATPTPQPPSMLLNNQGRLNFSWRA